jgi:hypothetical protein
MADLCYFRQLTITLPGLQFTKETKRRPKFLSSTAKKALGRQAKAPLALGPIGKRGRKGEKQ